MQPQVYQFYLKKDENTYYYVSGDSVLTSSNKVPINTSPDGWADIQLRITRNETTWGMFVTNAESLSFLGDGYQILHNIFATQCYEGKCTLLIEEYNSETFQYQFWGDGDLDFSYADDTDPRITLNIVQRGVAALVDSRKDITQQIPLDDPLALNIKVDGLKIRNVVSYTPNYYSAAGSSYVPVNALYRVSELGTGVLPNSTSVTSPAFYTAATNDNATLVFKNVKLSSQFGCILNILKVVPGNVSTVYWSHNQNAGDIINETITLVANPGDYFMLSINVVPGSGSTGWGQISDVDSSNKSSMEITAVMRFQTTTHKAFRYLHFLQRLVGKMTDGQYSVQSSFLSNTNTSSAFRKSNQGNSPWNTLVCSGNGVRGLAGSTVRSTFVEAMKDGWSRWTLCAGYEGNVIRIEPISYFLNKALDIGSIALVESTGVKVQPYMQKVFNQIKIGYKDYSYDELSGKEEFNTTLVMSFNKVLRDKKADDCISPYRADMFGWELLRNYLNPQAVLSQQAGTVDNESDNDTFLIEVNPIPSAGYYSPYRAAVSTITGLTYPETAYNCFISPKSCFLRHMSRIRSMLPVADRGVAIFQALDKNSEFSINFSGIAGEAVIEKANVPMNLSTYLGNPTPLLYLPFSFTAKAVPTRQMHAALLGNVYGFVTLKSEKQDFPGFILNTTLKTAQDGGGKDVDAEIILLAHPDTVLV